MPIEPLDDRPPPTIDPTLLTTSQLLREVANLKEIFAGELATIRQRLDGIDRATELVGQGVNRVPSDVDKQINHLRELVDERFTGIAQQFIERDTRAEREARDGKLALDAALAAQTTAAAKAEEAGDKARDKLEGLFNSRSQASDAKIEANAKTVNEKIEVLRADVSEIRQLVNGYAQNRVGGQEVTASYRDAGVAQRALITLGLTTVGLIIAVIGLAVAFAAKG